jgi:hypothetical protein
LIELDQIAGALLELLPRLDEVAVLRRLARQRAGTARIVPNARLR